MPRIFLSHSSVNDDWAIALRDWLVQPDQGWTDDEDIFLDLDPERGIAAGQRWVKALEDAATRCEAVLFLVSEAWLASKWCGDEYQLASKLNKKLFALLIEDIALDRLPGGLAAQWQIVRLKGEPAERFLTVHPVTQHQSPVWLAQSGLRSLNRGLEKAGIGPDTFQLLPDPIGPFGWRAPYRGLDALEPEDAAVFFGRSADIVRGIDTLRGLAARRPPRLLVILGASGAGKSSFLRAGLWPRLVRDDAQWLPLRSIRAGRGGAIEGGEGLLSALEEVHRRFDRPASRARLREQLDDSESFVTLLRELRQLAARRALLTTASYPLPVLCLDQAEELFAGDAGPEADHLIGLARFAIEGDEALVVATIRSDAYGLMQNSQVLSGIHQETLSLAPVPQGEIAHVIREPSQVLRGKAGPSAPVFDPRVVQGLQKEIEGEADALPLLAFVLQRLMREHAAAGTIGIPQLEQTGGVAAAIESEAEAALKDARVGHDRERRREVLRRLFIPRLARIDRETKAPQRRIARQSDVPKDLRPLVEALTQRRLLVTRYIKHKDGDREEDQATLEVAHEALLRRWPTLVELLAGERDALLLLDGVLSAAADWKKAEVARKSDHLVHRGSRLSDALALASRGTDWEREIVPAREYVAACLNVEKAVSRKARRGRVLVMALMFGIIAGLIVWINQAYVRDVTNWWWTMRPYMLANIRPYVLIAEKERALKPGQAFRECAKDCPEMVVVPAGNFLMGSPATESGRNDNEGPRQKVTIARPFAVSKFDVTFADWDACVTVGGCPQVSDTGLGRGTKPVINVSWEDAKQYVAWLSRMTGQTYRLLSEAEWEYAARGVTDASQPHHPYPWGDEIGTGNANCYACGSKWDNRQTSPVGSFKPNAFGLFDMHGNVWQWVEDCYHESLTGMPGDGSARATGDCSSRVVRGGSWDNLPHFLRSACRSADPIDGRYGKVGFRVGRTLSAGAGAITVSPGEH